MHEQKITIGHLYTDDQGKSQYETIEIDTNLIDFAPPAPKVFLSKPTETKQSFFLVFPPHWFGDKHLVPSKQLMTVISGSLEVTLSDGTKGTSSPGSTTLVEDTWGDGHITANNSDEEAVLFVVEL